MAYSMDPSYITTLACIICFFALLAFLFYCTDSTDYNAAVQERGLLKEENNKLKDELSNSRKQAERDSTIKDDEITKLRSELASTKAKHAKAFEKLRHKFTTDEDFIHTAYETYIASLRAFLVNPTERTRFERYRQRLIRREQALEEKAKVLLEREANQCLPERQRCNELTCVNNILEKSLAELREQNADLKRRNEELRTRNDEFKVRTEQSQIQTEKRENKHIIVVPVAVTSRPPVEEVEKVHKSTQTETWREETSPELPIRVNNYVCTSTSTDQDESSSIIAARSFASSDAERDVSAGTKIEASLSIGRVPPLRDEVETSSKGDESLHNVDAPPIEEARVPLVTISSPVLTPLEFEEGGRPSPQGSGEQYTALSQVSTDNAIGPVEGSVTATPAVSTSEQLVALIPTQNDSRASDIFAANWSIQRPVYTRESSAKADQNGHLPHEDLVNSTVASRHSDVQPLEHIISTAVNIVSQNAESQSTTSSPEAMEGIEQTPNKHISQPVVPRQQVNDQLASNEPRELPMTQDGLPLVHPNQYRQPESIEMQVDEQRDSNESTTMTGTDDDNPPTIPRTDNVFFSWTKAASASRQSIPPIVTSSMDWITIPAPTSAPAVSNISPFSKHSETSGNVDSRLRSHSVACEATSTSAWSFNNINSNQTVEGATRKRSSPKDTVMGEGESNVKPSSDAATFGSGSPTTRFAIRSFEPRFHPPTNVKKTSSNPESTPIPQSISSEDAANTPANTTFVPKDAFDAPGEKLTGIEEVVTDDEDEDPDVDEVGRSILDRIADPDDSDHSDISSIRSSERDALDACLRDKPSERKPWNVVGESDSDDDCEEESDDEDDVEFEDVYRRRRSTSSLINSPPVSDAMIEEESSSADDTDQKPNAAGQRAAQLRLDESNSIEAQIKAFEELREEQETAMREDKGNKSTRNVIKVISDKIRQLEDRLVALCDERAENGDDEYDLTDSVLDKEQVLVRARIQLQMLL